MPALRSRSPRAAVVAVDQAAAQGDQAAQEVANGGLLREAAAVADKVVDNGASTVVAELGLAVANRP